MLPRQILITPDALTSVSAECKEKDPKAIANWFGVESTSHELVGLVTDVGQNHRCDVYFRNVSYPDDDSLAVSLKLPKSKVNELLMDTGHVAWNDLPKDLTHELEWPDAPNSTAAAEDQEGYFESAVTSTTGQAGAASSSSAMTSTSSLGPSQSKRARRALRRIMSKVDMDVDCIAKEDANPRKRKTTTDHIEELAYVCRVVVDIREFETSGEGARTNVAQTADYIRELDAQDGLFPIVFMIDDACSTLLHLMKQLTHAARGEPVDQPVWIVCLLCSADCW